MIEWITLLGIPLLVVGGMIALIVQRGFQMKQLLQDGVETTGTIVKKGRMHTGSQSGLRSRWIRYRYTDAWGAEHSHRSHISHAVWDTLQEGDPFPVVYSQSRPKISAPRFLIEQCRAAQKPAA